MAALHDPSDSLELDDSDVEERTSDRRYTRAAARTGPVYSIHIGALLWSCYEAFDEEEGVECHWHKITPCVAGRGSISSERNALQDGGADGAAALQAEVARALDATMRLLEEWKHYSHDLLLNIKQLWRSNSRSIEVVAAFSGVHDLRAYLQMHEHLGEPAIRKIARQVLKAMIALQRHTHCPVHRVTAPDIHITAGSGRIVVLPTFAWRALVFSEPDPTCSDHQTETAPQSDAQPRPGAQVLELGAFNSATEFASAFRDQHSPGPSPLGRVTANSATHAELDGTHGVALQTMQGRALEAWARLVLELYMRAPEVAGWSVSRIRKELDNQALHHDAVALLSLATDEEQSRGMALMELLDHPWLNTRQCLAFHHSGTEPVSVQNVSIAEAFGIAAGDSDPARSAPSWRFSAVDSERMQPGACEAADDIVATAKSADTATVSASVLMGDEYRIAATGHVEEDVGTITFTMKLSRLDANAAHEESYKVLSFPYDVYHDTVDGVAAEMQQQFGLSTTDTELVASAMREVIALQLPGLENVMSVHSSLADSLRIGSRSMNLLQSGSVPPSIMTQAAGAKAP